jgi:Fe2+ or Zn2+ uptake regulation protein
LYIFLLCSVIIVIDNHYQYKMTHSNTDSIQNEWEKQLKLAGCRVTKPRREILRVIAESSHPLTPVEIYDRARENIPGLGLMTVYRTIEKMESLHLIDRIHNLGQCQSLFRGTIGHQHLLTCTGCGASVYFDGLESEKQFQEIGRANGYIVSGHWLQLYGTCEQCRKE